MQRRGSKSKEKNGRKGLTRQTDVIAHRQEEMVNLVEGRRIIDKFAYQRHEQGKDARERTRGWVSHTRRPISGSRT